MSVQDYLDKHMLSRKLEDAVNAAVRAKTSDPVLFIVSLYLSSSLFIFFPVSLIGISQHAFFR